MDGAPTEVTPAPKSSLACKNGATARSVMSNSSSNASVVSKSSTKNAPSGEDSLKELKAPPLPPRKASNNNNNSSNETNGLNHSSENITVLCEFDVPRTTAPPIPKHQTPPPITSRSSIDQLTHEFQQLAPPPLPNHHTINDQDVETVIVGPAETISGIIDTRPISHRKPISACSGNEQQQLTNNLYHIKNATSSPTMHVRNASLPVNNTAILTPSGRSIVHTSETLPKPAQPIPKPPCDLPPEIIRQSSQQRTSERPNSTPHSISTGSDHFLYENMTLNSSNSTTSTPLGNSVNTTTTMKTTATVQTPTTTTTNTLSDATSVCSVNTNHLTGKDCDNVPYENINLDYITRLMNEGYSKEHVITALGK